MSDDNVVQFPGGEPEPDLTAEEVAEMNAEELACFHSAPIMLQLLTKRLGRFRRLVELDAPAVIVEKEQELIRRVMPGALAVIAGQMAAEFGVVDVSTGEMRDDK